MFADNQIGADGAKALADALKTNTMLTKLNLYGTCWLVGVAVTDDVYREPDQY